MAEVKLSVSKAEFKAMKKMLQELIDSGEWYSTSNTIFQAKVVTRMMDIVEERNAYDDDYIGTKISKIADCEDMRQTMNGISFNYQELANATDTHGLDKFTFHPEACVQIALDIFKTVRGISKKLKSCKEGTKAFRKIQSQIALKLDAEYEQREAEKVYYEELTSPEALEIATQAEINLALANNTISSALADVIANEGKKFTVSWRNVETGKVLGMKNFTYESALEAVKRLEAEEMVDSVTMEEQVPEVKIVEVAEVEIEDDGSNDDPEEEEVITVETETEDDEDDELIDPPEIQVEEEPEPYVATTYIISNGGAMRPSEKEFKTAVAAYNYLLKKRRKYSGITRWTHIITYKGEHIYEAGEGLENGENTTNPEIQALIDVADAETERRLAIGEYNNYLAYWSCECSVTPEAQKVAVQAEIDNAAIAMFTEALDEVEYWVNEYQNAKNKVDHFNGPDRMHSDNEDELRAYWEKEMVYRKNKRAKALSELAKLKATYPQIFKTIFADKKQNLIYDVETATDFPIMADQFAALELAEAYYPSLHISGKITKDSGTLTAINADGVHVKILDDCLKIEHDGTEATIQFDISEKVFIEALSEVTAKMLETGEVINTFEIVGKSGLIYTYTESTLRPIRTETQAEYEARVNAAPKVAKVTNCAETVKFWQILRHKQQALKAIINEHSVAAQLKYKVQVAEILKIVNEIKKSTCAAAA